MHTSTSSSKGQAQQRWQAGQQAMKQREFQRAAREYEQAIRLAPQDALYRLSLASLRLSQLDLAAAELDARCALSLEPRNVLTHRLLAQVLLKQNRAEEAVQLLQAYAQDKTNQGPEFLMDLGAALLNANRPAEAVPVLMQVLQTEMANALAYQHLGMAFQMIERPRDAAICFETAVAVDKGGEVRTLALSQLVHQLQQAGEWADLQKHVDALLAALNSASDAVAAQILPFTLLPIASTPEQQLRVARLRSQTLTSAVTPLPPPPPQRRPGPLRIGYLSCDFHNHATALLITELLELHDRERFEVILYCHSPEDGTGQQQRIRAAADRVRDVRALSDEALARCMREDGIDIAIDLKGHTRDSRFQALAWRPAPVQASFLGFPGSTGAGFIDYLVGDAVVTPAAHQQHYRERIAQLPHSYQPNDSRRALPLAPPRAALGLPDEAVVLCCFNQTYKISPAVVDCWGQILRAAPDTVLWLLSWNPRAEENLRAAFAERGIAAERLIFTPLAGIEDHLARLQCADLFLDTWPCNAHTTASEALWAGVPVLTVPGTTFASRVAASLVMAVGQAQNICANPQAYVDRAVALTHDLAALRRAQAHLREQRMSLPLFDSRRYARDFEALLQRMWARHEAGLKPEFLPGFLPAQSS